MIIVGVIFCVASFYAVFGEGAAALISGYRSLGPFSFAFMVFYGFAGGLTSVFHLSYLVRGWPEQLLAGVYAIAIALSLAALSVAVMEFVARPLLPN